MANSEDPDLTSPLCQNTVLNRNFALGRMIHAIFQALLIFEPRHNKTCLGFPTRSDIKWATQPRRMVSGLKFLNYEEERLYYEVKTKAVIRCAVTTQLICAFVLAYA